MSEDQFPGVDSIVSATPTGAPAINNPRTASSNTSGSLDAGTDPDGEVAKNGAFLDRIWARISPSSVQRLRSAIPVFQEELDALKARNCGKLWAKSADNLLEKAQQAVKAKDAACGWRCLKAADRFTLYGLDNVEKTLLKNRAMVIFNEATDDGKGLPQWRLASIKALLTDKDGKLLDPVNVDQLVEAKRLLDDHQDNVYQRLSILKSRLALLTGLGIAFLAVWLFILQPPVPQIIVSSGASDHFESIGHNAAVFWWVVVLAGVLGGLISAFTSAIGANIRKSNIPAELSTQTITFARLVVAPLSALAVTLFLSSGILSFRQLSYALIITVAVVSGFTDRLLLGAIERVAKPS